MLDNGYYPQIPPEEKLVRAGGRRCGRARLESKKHSPRFLRFRETADERQMDTFPLPFLCWTGYGETNLNVHIQISTPLWRSNEKYISHLLRYMRREES